MAGIGRRIQLHEEYGRDVTNLLRWRADDASADEPSNSRLHTVDRSPVCICPRTPPPSFRCKGQQTPLTF